MCVICKTQMDCEQKDKQHVHCNVKTFLLKDAKQIGWDNTAFIL